MAYNPINANGQATMANSQPVTLASDQSNVPIKGGFVSQAFTTTTAQAVGTYDALGNGLSWVSVHIATQGTTSTVTFQTSDDNTNWVSVTLYISTTTGTTSPASNTTTAAVLYTGPVQGRYFRLNVTGITGGTTAGTIVFSGMPLGVIAPAVLANQTGTWTTIPGGSATTGTAATAYSLISAATTNATNVKATAGRLYSFELSNTSASAKYVKFYNSATAPTAGSGTPVKRVLVPATGTTAVSFPVGIAFSAGIGFTITGAAADTDTTAVAASDVLVNLDYL